MKLKKIICLFLASVMLLALVSCKNAENTTVDTNKQDSESVADSGENPKIAITVKDYGTMTFELYPDIAPITVENFLKYVDDGFYNGLTFHRIYSGFMIQGGDPKGDGTGNGKFGNIKGEFSANGVSNTISHERGVISMARGQANDSASCQFFICHADSKFLDGNYAAFGKITEGLDVLDAIASAKVTANIYSGELSTPVNPPVIESIVRVAD